VRSTERGTGSSGHPACVSYGELVGEIQIAVRDKTIGWFTIRPLNIFRGRAPARSARAAMRTSLHVWRLHLIKAVRLKVEQNQLVAGIG
jgi:hypothetical protein